MTPEQLEIERAKFDRWQDEMQVGKTTINGIKWGTSWEGWQAALANQPKPTAWQPIETAPKDNKRKLYLARLLPDGLLVDLDFEGAWDTRTDDWYGQQGLWGGAITHWAYQDEPIPQVVEPANSTSSVVEPKTENRLHKWQSLTDQETIELAYKNKGADGIVVWALFAKDLEDALKEKNQ